MPLLPLVLLLAVQAASGPGPAPDPGPAIADNSFLIEEAYNQEAGVVQHISTFARRFGDGNWSYTFTQEWPIDAAPAHQVSYTVSVLDGAPRAGLGDVWLHWRYQLGTSTAAVAPRVSVGLPTGSEADGRGEGRPAIQVNVPVSLRTRLPLVLHFNAGATIVPRALATDAGRAPAASIQVGQSVVWLAHRRVNALVEWVAIRERGTGIDGRIGWTTQTIVNPGIRWSHDLPGDVQVVPGIAVPIELSASVPHRWSLFAYLSVEHRFRR